LVSALKNSVVVFAPHPDDEILGCGGTIVKKIQEGFDVFIVFLTDGRNALRDIGILFEPSPEELVEIRKKEAILAAKAIGIRAENLSFCGVEDGLLSQNAETAMGAITDALRKTPVEVYFPQEKEFNIDHRAANKFVRSVILSLDIAPSEFQYIIAWQYPLNILPRIPHVGVRRCLMSRLLNLSVVGSDITEFLDTKKKALQEYQSQFSLVSKKQHRPVIGDSFAKRFLKDEEEFFVFTESRRPNTKEYHGEVDA
jgi:LmbE family N-acetylglucosaminyl deacetylase